MHSKLKFSPNDRRLFEALIEVCARIWHDTNFISEERRAGARPCFTEVSATQGPEVQ